MKALSIKQPWAGLVVSGIKDVENRKWRCGYRGPLLIHAGKGWDQYGYEFLSNEMGVLVPRKSEHVFGAILGIVQMTDCVRGHPSRWFFGPWGFVFEDARKFPTPIPWKGELKIFEVTIDQGKEVGCDG